MQCLVSTPFSASTCACIADQRPRGESSPIAGAAEKISTLRYRYQQVTESLAQLEARVAANAAELERMSQAYDHHDDDFEDLDTPQQEVVNVTDEDIAREIEEIRELERKKRALEDRVSGMERDLGGLMR